MFLLNTNAVPWYPIANSADIIRFSSTVAEVLITCSLLLLCFEVQFQLLKQSFDTDSQAWQQLTIDSKKVLVITHKARSQLKAVLPKAKNC